MQRLATDELHHDEIDAVGLLNVMDRDDVGMVQAGRRLGFLQEAAPAVWGLVAFWQDLDGHLALQADINGLVNDAHPATADFGADGVARRSRRERRQHSGFAKILLPLRRCE
jgi:hypothetical protein